jgi:hypothetical protein
MQYLTDLPFVLDARETNERFGVTASPLDGLVAETLTAL